MKREKVSFVHCGLPWINVGARGTSEDILWSNQSANAEVDLALHHQRTNPGIRERGRHLRASNQTPMHTTTWGATCATRSCMNCGRGGATQRNQHDEDGWQEHWGMKKEGGEKAICG